MGSRKAWRTAVAAVVAFLLLVLTPGPARAEETDPDLLEAAFVMLEEGNPFAARYEQITGKEITPLFPCGVPYYFGGVAKPSGNGYFYISYPDYYTQVCGHSSGYFCKGQRYFYGVDCAGFVNYVYLAAKHKQLPHLGDMLTEWSCRAFHVYDHQEGKEAPPYDQLKDTLIPGDLLVIRHEEGNRYRHVMMYIGTLRDFGYTAEDEPALADWLDYPLVIHCGNSPFYGERFQKLIDENPEKYGRCTTTDGGVAVSILGVEPAKAPEHGHIQDRDYDWFTMKDGGYQLTVLSFTDVKYYCWYRP